VEKRAEVEVEVLPSFSHRGGRGGEEGGGGGGGAAVVLAPENTKKKYKKKLGGGEGFADPAIPRGCREVAG
jgi:hypothetical protein